MVARFLLLRPWEWGSVMFILSLISPVFLFLSLPGNDPSPSLRFEPGLSAFFLFSSGFAGRYAEVAP